MTMIEDDLRAAFIARTRTLPAMDDPADAAIRQAKAIRRRRGIAGTAVMLLFVLGASGGVIRFAGGFGQPPSTVDLDAESPARVAAANTMDVRVGQELWTADGRHLTLSQVGTVTWIHRVPAGWLYAGDTGGVRLLYSDGSSTDPLIDGTDVAVSPDGTRLAWRTTDPKVDSVTIYAATLSKKGVIADRSSATAPVGVEPIGFAGARVLLRQAVEAKHYRFDFWTIGHTYTPTWIDKVSALYGEYQSSVIGRVPGTGGEHCLALFEPATDGLRLERKKCGLDLTDSAEGALSPTGRWLAVRTATKLRVLDLDTIFTDGPTPGPSSSPVAIKPARPVTCVAEAATGPPIWIDAKFVVATTNKGWSVCTTSGKVDAVDDPALAQLTWMPVPGNG
jgi:hypothetical protein